MPVKVYEPIKPGLPDLELRDIWERRALIWLFARRELALRYSKSKLGIIWLFIQPLAMLVVYSLVFGAFFKTDTGSVPYSVYTLVGLVVWNTFASLAIQTALAIIQADALIRKVAFPRLALLLARIPLVLPEWVFGMLLSILLLIVSGFEPRFTWLLLPLLGVLTVFIGFFVGLVSTVVAAKLPDVIHVIGPGLNLVLWLTPVFYPTSLIPANWQPILWLNPMASLISAYRWALFGEALPAYPALLVWFGLIPLFVLSLYLFKRVELKLVDWL